MIIRGRHMKGLAPGMRINGMGRGLLIAAMLVVGLAVAVPANAILFQITSDHCSGTCGTPPFGTVNLTQNGTTVDVDVHLFDGNLFAKTGAVDDQAFKFNGAPSLASITVDAHVPALVPATGAFNGDGTGNFGFGINCPTCANGGAGAFNNDILFHVANATIADLTAPNNLGIIFVADMLSGTTGNTGPVDATVPNVPEPASLLLLGSGLVGLGAWRWKKSQV